MTKSILFFCLILFSFFGNAQFDIDVKIGHNYQFITGHAELKEREDKLLSFYDALTVFSKEGNQFNKTDFSNEVIDEGLVVRALYIEDGDVLFSYWPFDKDDPRDQIYAPKTKVFSLPIEAFSKLTTERFDRFMGYSIKPFTVPIRLRGVGTTNFEFETNLSIGSSISTGYRYNPIKENRYFEFSAGLGITKVNLKPSNSNLEEETLSPAAFTIALGILGHYDRVNAGIFFGWDSLSGEEQIKYEWIHNKELWIGLGINIGLENQSNDKQKEGKQPKGS